MGLELVSQTNRVLDAFSYISLVLDFTRDYTQASALTHSGASAELEHEDLVRSSTTASIGTNFRVTVLSLLIYQQQQQHCTSVFPCICVDVRLPNCVQS